MLPYEVRLDGKKSVRNSSLFIFFIDNQLVKNKYRSRIFNKNFIDLYYEPGSAALREVNYNK